ncbi:MAG: L-serine ammonia-lyase, iron-sulfur-dependent subunit beta [Chitinophagales bacterium]
MPSLLDIIGPIIIGPSSSHTAGAARLGLAARSILGFPVKKVRFRLHGSFAQTSVGHGTDRALLGGVMGFRLDDDRLRLAYQYADTNRIEYSFTQDNLGDVHPNSVRIELDDGQSHTCVVTGASVGGGSILIYEVDDFSLNITCEYPTLVTFHQDIPGAVAAITAVLAQNNINIAFLRVYRQTFGGQAAMVAETDQSLEGKHFSILENLQFVHKARFIDRI